MENSFSVGDSSSEDRELLADSSESAIPLHSFRRRAVVGALILAVSALSFVSVLSRRIVSFTQINPIATSRLQEESLGAMDYSEVKSQDWPCSAMACVLYVEEASSWGSVQSEQNRKNCGQACEYLQEKCSGFLYPNPGDHGELCYIVGPIPLEAEVCKPLPMSSDSEEERDWLKVGDNVYVISPFTSDASPKSTDVVRALRTARRRLQDEDLLEAFRKQMMVGIAEEKKAQAQAVQERIVDNVTAESAVSNTEDVVEAQVEAQYNEAMEEVAKSMRSQLDEASPAAPSVAEKKKPTKDKHVAETIDNDKELAAKPSEEEEQANAKEKVAKLAQQEEEAKEKTVAKKKAEAEAANEEAAKLAQERANAKEKATKLAQREEEAKEKTVEKKKAEAEAANEEAAKLAQEREHAKEKVAKLAQQEVEAKEKTVAKKKAEAASAKEEAAKLAQERETAKEKATNIAQESEDAKENMVAEKKPEAETKEKEAAKLAPERENAKEKAAKLAPQEEDSKEKMVAEIKTKAATAKEEAAKLAQEREKAKAKAAKLAQQEEDAKEKMVAEKKAETKAGKKEAAKLAQEREPANVKVAKLAQDEEDAKEQKAVELTTAQMSANDVALGDNEEASTNGKVFLDAGAQGVVVRVDSSDAIVRFDGVHRLVVVHRGQDPVVKGVPGENRGPGCGMDPGLWDFYPRKTYSQ